MLNNLVVGNDCKSKAVINFFLHYFWNMSLNLLEQKKSPSKSK